jgi:hypothetical protein
MFSLPLFKSSLTFPPIITPPYFPFLTHSKEKSTKSCNNYNPTTDHFNMSANDAVERLATWFRIRKVIACKLGQETGYPE